MRKLYHYFILIAFMLGLASCSNREVPPAEYVHYVQNPANGLQVNQKVNGVSYTLQYEPVDYCVMLEKRSFSIPKEVFKQEYNRFKGLEHYTLKIDKEGTDKLMNVLSDTSAYKKSKTTYFDFAIQKDIKLIEGTDTIPCSICQLDANTGISPYYTYTLGFYHKSGTAGSADRVVYFQSKPLNTGNVLLCVKNKAIKNIPGLKIGKG